MPGDTWIIIPGAILFWTLFSLCLILPQPFPTKDDMKGAFLAGLAGLLLTLGLGIPLTLFLIR